MSQQLILSQTHVLPLTTIRRHRVLPWQGEVLVGTGRPVEPSDVVARAGKPRPHVILDVGQLLGVSAEQALDCYVKRPGEPVHQGEVLATGRNWPFASQKITSPVEGMLIAAESGRMIIQPRPEMFELRALLSGMVTSIAPGSGVTIDTPGALIQGVWGSGREGYGKLKMGVTEPGATLSGDQIEVAHHGCVLICGATLDLDLMDKAQEVQARGLIVGGVPADLRNRIAEYVIPVIATEGIGRIPMSSVVFDLLRANEGREAMMLAVKPDRWNPERPEVIIPLPATGALEPPSPSATALWPGAKVRIRRAPLWGQVGTITAIHIQPRGNDGDVKYPGADVALDDGTVIFIPYVNLDLVG